MDKETDKKGYTAQNIQILEGLDPVRKRPGMYIGSTGVDGLHHLIWELVNNSIDEAMAGYAKHITIELLPGNRVSVADNGRGIPVDIHPQTKKSALETVMTTLHAGGKFDSKSYKTSGGLHGVGASVVNALSSWTYVEVYRDNTIYFQEYKKGKPLAPVKKSGKSTHTGTKTIFEADLEIFQTVEFDRKKILDYIRQQAYLTKGVKIEVIDLRGEVANYHAFHFDGGLYSFVKYLNSQMGAKPIQEEIFYVHKNSGKIEVEVSFLYNEDIETKEMSFANNIYTTDGGTHITGFRTALTRYLNDYARSEGFIKEKDENFTGDDVREGLVVAVSVKISEPQFEGQTKARLGSTEARPAVETVVGEALKEFLEKRPADARKIIEKCILSLKARKAAKAARETVLRKGILEGLTLPGKLADCSSKSPEESEIFIVEGDSAGGSAKQGRDRRFQAILPLRGKILNVEKSRIDKMLANKEIRSLVIAMGTAIANDFNIEKLRYHKIVIMTDADVDGAHISTLLLTLFYRYFPQVIENNNLYIAQPPLYKIQVGKALRYAYNDKEKEVVIKELSAGKAQASVNIQRYKGLGEMNPDQLWETTLNPENRVLKLVHIEDAEEASRMFNILMGDEVEPRRHFIEAHAAMVKNLDI